MCEKNSPNLPTHLQDYDSMDLSERRAFEDLVEKGGEVTGRGLSERLKQAYLLGYVREGNQLIAIGAVKNPAESYVHKVSRSAKFDLNGYGAELGWIYVAPEARGRQLATSISHALCNSHKGSIFATTRCDNAGMQAILRKLDFKKVGLDYDSVEHPGKQIELWVRQR